MGSSSSQERRTKPRQSLTSQAVFSLPAPNGGFAPARGRAPRGSGDRHAICPAQQRSAHSVAPTHPGCCAAARPAHTCAGHRGGSPRQPAAPRRTWICRAVRWEPSVPRDTDSKTANSTIPSASTDSPHRVYGHPPCLPRIGESAQSANRVSWRAAAKLRRNMNEVSVRVEADRVCREPTEAEVSSPMGACSHSGPAFRGSSRIPTLMNDVRQSARDISSAGCMVSADHRLRM